MTFSRILLVTVATTLFAGGAQARDGGHDHQRIQHSIYGVIEGEAPLYEGRSSADDHRVVAPHKKFGDVVPDDEPFYFRKANERGSNS